MDSSLFPDTFNTPECDCGEDHDSLEHIFKGTQIAIMQGIFEQDEAAQYFAAAAHAVGWRKY